LHEKKRITENNLNRFLIKALSIVNSHKKKQYLRIMF